MLALPAAPAACMSNFGLNRFSCYFVQTSSVLSPLFTALRDSPYGIKSILCLFPKL